MASCELLVHPLQAGPQQLVAVGEVDVDGGAGHAGLGGDLVHGDLGGAALAEEAAGHVDDLVPPEVADDLAQRSGERRATAAQAVADGRRGGEGHREVLHAVDELRLQALHVAVLVDVGQAVEQVLEHHLDLHAGQVGPQAEVRAAAAEGDVGVGVPADVEDVGVLEDVLVAVGRGVEEDDLVALLDRRPAQLEVAGGGAAEVHDRA